MKFKVRDILKYKGGSYLSADTGSLAKVICIDTYKDNGWIQVEWLDRIKSNGQMDGDYSPEKFELFQETKFKVGDRVRGEKVGWIPFECEAIFKGQSETRENCYVFERLDGNHLGGGQNNWWNVQKNCVNDWYELITPEERCKPFYDIYSSYLQEYSNLTPAPEKNKGVGKIMSDIRDFAKNLVLSADEKILRKHGLKDECGVWTDSAMDIVDNMLCNEKTKELVEIAKKKEAEEKK